MKESVQLSTNIPVKWIGNIPYIAILLLICINAWNKPLYNREILPYIGVMVGYEHSDTSLSAKTIHDKTYTLAKKQLPADVYAQLTSPSNTYGYKLAQSPVEFSQQMPFYVVKPLYTFLAWGYYKAGVSVGQATVMPSILGYFCMGLLLITWLSKSLPYWSAFLISLLVMISPPLLDAVRSSSPDCLSAFLLLYGIYFVTQNKPGWGYCLLLISVFARLDNILPLIVIVFTLGRQKKLSVLNCSLGILLALVCYFNIAYSAYSYGWGLLYFTSFFIHNSSYSIHVGFSADNYAELVKQQIMIGLYYSHIIFFAILVVIQFIKKPSVKPRKLDMEQILSLIIILIIAIRFLLQPVVVDSIYIAYYLAIIVFVAKRYTSMLRY